MLRMLLERLQPYKALASELSSGEFAGMWSIVNLQTSTSCLDLYRLVLLKKESPQCMFRPSTKCVSLRFE